jgi:hypothetical protein
LAGHTGDDRDGRRDDRTTGTTGGRQGKLYGTLVILVVGDKSMNAKFHAATGTDADKVGGKKGPTR